MNAVWDSAALSMEIDNGEHDRWGSAVVCWPPVFASPPARGMGLRETLHGRGAEDSGWQTDRLKFCLRPRAASREGNRQSRPIGKNQIFQQCS